jgi:hypothetical protein
LRWVIHKSAPLLIELFGYVFPAALAQASAIWVQGSIRNGECICHRPADALHRIAPSHLMLVTNRPGSTTD